MHRYASYRVSLDEFSPERWPIPNSETGINLLPLKRAYRALEIGLRNGMAQGFVVTELRAILALLIRRFDATPAYDEWDRLQSQKGKT